MQPVISFIVPAYNEEQLLGPTLEAIHSAARAVGKPYELIVVDDGSTDQTALVARHYHAVVGRFNTGRYQPRATLVPKPRRVSFSFS